MVLSKLSSLKPTFCLLRCIEHALFTVAMANQLPGMSETCRKDACAGIWGYTARVAYLSSEVGKYAALGELRRNVLVQVLHDPLRCPDTLHDSPCKPTSLGSAKILHAPEWH